MHRPPKKTSHIQLQVPLRPVNNESLKDMLCRPHINIHNRTWYNRGKIVNKNKE